MARRIIWSHKAVYVFNRILEFYFQRNGSKIYSSRLNKEIRETISLLIKHPFIGKKTESDHLRVIIKGELKIFYQVGENDILILMIWDSRQDPDSLNL